MKFQKIILALMVASNLLFAQEIAKDSTQTDSIKFKPANLYKNGIGIKLFKGLSYKHYFKYISAELNLGLGFAGIYGTKINPQLIVCYQNNNRHAIQPYIGLALDYMYLSDGYQKGANVLTTSAIVYVYPSVVAGIEWFVKKTRLSFCVDGLIGFRNYSLFNYELNAGVKIRFTKIKI